MAEPLRTTWVNSDPDPAGILNSHAAVINSLTAGSARAVRAGDLVINVRDYATAGLADDADWTSAFVAAFDAAKAAGRAGAAVGGTVKRLDLPTVYVPPGRYRLSPGVLLLRYVEGFRLQGAGQRASRLRFTGTGVGLDLDRARGVVVADLMLENLHPSGAQGGVTGLTENSTAVRVRTLSTDGASAGGVSMQVTFERVDFEGFHRGVHFTGDIQDDAVQWVGCRWFDCFHALSYENGQAVNHQGFGGEMVWAVNFPIGDYTTRLAAWTTPRHPYDAALIDVQSGGALTWVGGSFIGNCATLHFREPDGSMGDGGVNVNAFTFVAGKWEFRVRDEPDGNGQQRVTMVRYAQPYPPTVRVSCLVRFVGGEVNLGASVVAPVTLVHVANSMRITWDGVKVYQPTLAQVVGLVESSVSTGALGQFVARDSTWLPYSTALKPGSSALGVRSHIVDIAGDLRGRNLSDAVRAPFEFHALVPGVPQPVRRLVERSGDGLLMGSGGFTASRTVTLPAGAMIREIGVVITSGTGSLTVEARNSAATKTYATLTANTAADPRPRARVEDYADANGQVALVVPAPTGATLFGYVYVEYA